MEEVVGSIPIGSTPRTECLDEDRTFTATVTRAEPTEDGRWVECGLTYREMDDDFRNWLHQ
jgi:hypothetical protein